LEDQIVLGEIEDKGLDHQEHAGRGEFQIIEAMHGRRTEKVRVQIGRGNRDQRGVITAGS